MQPEDSAEVMEALKATRQPSALSLAPNRLFAWLDHLSVKKVILLLSLAACLAYAHSLGGDFVHDDLDEIVNNPNLRSWDKLGNAFTTHFWQFYELQTQGRVKMAHYYRPLVTVLLTLEYHGFGLWPQGWHLVSLLLHLLSSFMVYLVLRHLSHKPSLVVIAAILFAVYPTQVETVSWISGLPDPLMGIFYLGSFYFYLQFQKAKRPRHMIGSLVLFLLSTLVKESALSLVVLVFCFSWMTAKTAHQQAAAAAQVGVSIKRRWEQAITLSLPYALVAGIYLALRGWALGSLYLSHEANAYKVPTLEVLWTVPWVLCTYILHLVYPVDLSIAYNTSFVTSPATLRFLLPAATLLVLGLALLIFRKKVKTEIWYALALFLAPLVVALNLRSLLAEYLIADRYLYLPTIGWAYLLALGLDKLAAIEAQWPKRTLAKLSRRQPFLASAIAVSLIVLLSLATWRESKAWESSETLWNQAIRVRPDYWIPYYYKGDLLLRAGRLPEARDALILAAEHNSQQATVYAALGQTYAELAQFDLAIETYQQALNLNPKMIKAYDGLGSIFFNAKDFQAAEKYFQAAVALNPDATDELFHLGLTYNYQGRFAEAIPILEKALRSAPLEAEPTYQLGKAYGETGRKDEARNLLQRLFTLHPSEDLKARATAYLEKLRPAP
ncbi:MAG: tetratricopeptide repeat protein [Acidobacteria bacterium]|nr:tetratricopeptide repeat protein [Acidobacteriota bacterium]